MVCRVDPSPWPAGVPSSACRSNPFELRIVGCWRDGTPSVPGGSASSSGCPALLASSSPSSASPARTCSSCASCPGVVCPQPRPRALLPGTPSFSASRFVGGTARGLGSCWLSRTPRRISAGTPRCSEAVGLLVVSP